MVMTLQIVDMTTSSNFWHCLVSLVKFSYWSYLHVNMIIGSGVMTSFFYKALTRIRKSEILLSHFCPMSGDWAKLVIPNLARMSLMKCYWILQNARITPCTVSELLRENQQWGEVKLLFIHIRVKLAMHWLN